MSALKPITLGTVYGRLTVIGAVSKHYYECRCECGEVKVVKKGDLRTGNTRSCGCLVSDRIRECNTRHGHAPRSGVSSEYIAWSRMLSRTLNPKNPDWLDYGGRGITVTEKWLEFSNFLADMGQRPPRTSLNRSNNDGPYCKDNCIWSSPKAQARNRRSSLFVTVDGVQRLFIECAEENGISYKTAHARLKRGWSIDRVFLPLHSPRCAKASADATNAASPIPEIANNPSISSSADRSNTASVS